MPTYAFRDAGGDVVLMAPEFSMPIPVHAQIAQRLRAEEQAGESDAVRRRMRTAELVTKVDNPPMYRGALVPTNAKKLAAAAEAEGFEVRTLLYDDGCEIQGHHAERREGFRAGYVRGRAAYASWHTPYRYTIIRDTRPIKMNTRDRVGLKGYRSEGMSETRLQLLGRPQGMKITHTELTARLVAE